MKKIKYAFLVIASFVFFEACLKAPTPVPGEQGAQGPQGAQGGNFLPLQTLISLNGIAFSGSSPNYYYDWVFSGYNQNTTYMLSAYVSKVNSFGQTTLWYKLPCTNIYTTGDELYASLKNDTVKICYYNTTSAWPVADSVMDCRIIVIPQPQ